MGIATRSNVQLWPAPPGRSIGARSVASSSDSPLEEAGFEPSVPRGAIKVSRGAHLVSAGFPANGKVGANENRHHDDAPRPPRDRWFESCSLQRRVSLSPAAGFEGSTTPAFRAGVCAAGLETGSAEKGDERNAVVEDSNAARATPRSSLFRKGFRNSWRQRRSPKGRCSGD